ncbi:HAD family hydrolase, partial [Halorubrum sp. SS5]
MPVTPAQGGVYDAVVLDNDGVLVGRTPFDT